MYAKALGPFLLSALMPLLAVPVLLRAAEPDAPAVWILEFRDDFQRVELGNNWSSNDAALHDGRMLVGRDRPACAKIVRSFPADVRIEFDAQAYEDRPPCDLSVTLAAGRLKKMSFNYLLAFGGVNNTVNKLTGGRKLTGTYDKAPKRLIEPGRVYHLVATKEGKRLCLTVDGQPLLEGIDEQIMGGPAFDAVGLVTWNGMYVDNVRVYRRAVPHPDTPRYLSRLAGLLLSVDRDGRLTGPKSMPASVKQAIEAYNVGNLPAAEAAFKAAHGEYRAAGLAYLYGNLNYDERPEDFPLISRLLSELSAAAPSDRRLADYAQAASWFGRVRIFPRSRHECSLLMTLGPNGNPFYDKAKLYRARFLRASGQEGHNREELDTAAAMFRQLAAKAPENVTLRELTGQRIPWGRDLIESDPTVPRWAAVLHEIYVRQLTIMNWWFTHRQMPDGQIGGGWGDDVELLRSWGPFAMISDADPTVRDGIERLCQGVWDNVLRDGFAATMGDVEHSAEPSADTLPTMLALRYGDPTWYRRNLASCRRIRDCYMDVDNRGFVRFKSAYIGGDRASDDVRHGGDTYYSVRPMKHFLWSAWYGDCDARRFYLDWVRGWVEATMKKRSGKPIGVPPATIWYPSGDIAPSGNIHWNDPTYNIYGRAWIGNHWLQDAFLAAHYLSRDPYYLRPLHAWMRLYQSEIPDSTAAEPDSAEDPSGWALRNAKHTWNSSETFAGYRWLTGDCTYDDLLGNVRVDGRLHLGQGLDAMLDRLESTLDHLRVNFNLATREVIQTDRADLPGDQAVLVAMTGAVRGFGDAGVPTMAVTWDFPHRDTVALVVYASEEHVRLWIYNFAPQAESVGIRPWQLLPGMYEVNRGLLGQGNGLNRVCNWQSVTKVMLRERAAVFRIEVPSRREFVVDFRLQKPIDVPPVLPDPAIAAGDVRVARGPHGKTDVTATVYNLGGASVPRLTVGLVGSIKGSRNELARQTIGPLPACKELRAGNAKVSFRAVPVAEKVSVVLDPDDTVREICESNNLGNARAGAVATIPENKASKDSARRSPPGYVRGDVVSYSYVPIRTWRPREGIGILPYLFEYRLLKFEDDKPLETFHEENVRRIDIAGKWSTAIMLYARHSHWRDEIINLMIRAFRHRQLIVLSNYHDRGAKDGGPYNNVKKILDTLWTNRDTVLVNPEGDRATGRQLINNVLANKCGDEGLSSLRTAGLREVYADFDRVIRLREIDGEKPFRHIKAWYNMIGYAALDYNGPYAASQEDVDKHRRVKLPSNTQCIGVDVYHYWGHDWSPFDPADLSISREKVRAHTNEWHRLRTRYYPQGLKVRVGQNSHDPKTWVPEYWNDTHALMGGIELAGARNAMMWYIGVSGQLTGGKREPATYTTPVETMEAYFDELKAGPWVGLSWWVFGDFSESCQGGLRYYDRTLKHYTPAHPVGEPYSEELLDYWHREYVSLKMRMFNDVVHGQFKHLNGPVSKK